MNRVRFTSEEYRIRRDVGDFRREIRVKGRLLESGVWRVTLRYLFIGEKGAAQFGVQLLTVQPWEVRDFLRSRWEGYHWMEDGLLTPTEGDLIVLDVGFHLPTGEGPCPCDLFGTCRYEGSPALGSKLLEAYRRERAPEVIWEELKRVYVSRM